MAVPGFLTFQGRHAVGYPIGGVFFPPWYFDFLRDLARLPWSRIPQNPVQAMVKMAAERKRVSQ